jgi:hypothetical protein
VVDASGAAQRDLILHFIPGRLQEHHACAFRTLAAEGTRPGPVKVPMGPTRGGVQPPGCLAPPNVAPAQSRVNRHRRPVVGQFEMAMETHETAAGSRGKMRRIISASKEVRRPDRVSAWTRSSRSRLESSSSCWRHSELTCL